MIPTFLTIPGKRVLVSQWFSMYVLFEYAHHNHHERACRKHFQSHRMAVDTHPCMPYLLKSIDCVGLIPAFLCTDNDSGNVLKSDRQLCAPRIFPQCTYQKREWLTWRSHQDNINFTLSRHPRQSVHLFQHIAYI